MRWQREQGSGWSERLHGRQDVEAGNGALNGWGSGKAGAWGPGCEYPGKEEEEELDRNGEQLRNRQQTPQEGK